ncbi:MAG: TonB-dependent receptor, partial [Brevundimonas sp.]|nr:TonB-dependent receptor [Brevundimonas sp.]
MRLTSSPRFLLLGAAASALLAGAASAQTTPTQTSPTQPVALDDIIVTGAPYGISQRATTIATDVIDAQTLATAPAVSL